MFFSVFVYVLLKIFLTLLSLAIPLAVGAGLYFLVTRRKYPFFILPLSAVTCAIVIVLSCMLAALHTSYSGQKEWKESRYFYTFFLEQLKKTGDIRQSAARMLRNDIREKNMQHIEKTVQPIFVKGNICLAAGTFVLLGALALPFIPFLRQKKYYPLYFFATLIAGLSLLAPGAYYRQYAANSRKGMNWILTLQLEGMQKTSSAPQQEDITRVITFTEKYIREEKVFFDRGERFFWKLKQELKPPESK